MLYSHIEKIMSVGLLIVSHNELGDALLKTVESTLGRLPLSHKAFKVGQDTDPFALMPELKAVVNRMDHGDGVLVLTDMFGSTPSNLAQALQDEANVRVVTGLNLPMLVRVMNYPELSLEQLAQKAFSGGRDGVLYSEHVDAPTALEGA